MEPIKNREIGGEKHTPPTFELATSNYVILNYQSKWHWTFKNATPAKLTHSELIEIESIIKIAIRENNKTQREVLNEHNQQNPNHQITETAYELQLDEYKRQYVPVLNNKGQKEVYINFFCNALDQKDWRYELIQVEDGGICFYNLVVNLETKAYNLEINYSL